MATSGVVAREATRIWHGDSPTGSISGIRGVWCTGTTARGLMHAQSDVDIVALVDGGREPTSYVVDGVRIDLRFLEVAELRELQGRLASYRVWFDDVTEFRAVRRTIDELTALVTASPAFHGDGAGVTTGDRDVYLRYALADEVERVHSLIEDAVGLKSIEEWESLEIVRCAVVLRLISAHVVSLGEPKVGDKWLPVVLRGLSDGESAAAAARRLNGLELTRGIEDFLGQVRDWLEVCLGRLWPGGPPGKDTGDWLPQVYSDGWFDRSGNTRTRRQPAACSNRIFARRA